MSQEGDSYRDWMRGYLVPRYPELVPAMSKAIDAFESLIDQPDGTRTQIKPIEDLARSPRGSVYETATQMLGRLSATMGAAQDAIVEMSNDKSAAVRFNALLSLRSTTPPDLIRRVIRTGLRDRSTRVRIKAGDWSLRLQVRDLVPDLETALSCERNSKTAKELAFDLALLRDGYLVRDEDEQAVNVTVLLPGGGIRSCNASRQEAEELGLDELARRIRDGRR